MLPQKVILTVRSKMVSFRSPSEEEIPRTREGAC